MLARALHCGVRGARRRTASLLALVFVLGACSSDPGPPELRSERSSTTKSQVTIAPSTTSTTIPSELLDIMNGAGMTDRSRAVFLASDPKIEDAATFARSCRELSTAGDDRAHTHGCFVDGKIHMRAIGAPEISDLIYVVAAHEVLHAVYARLTDSERTRLDAQLDSLRKTTLKLRERLKAYSAADVIDAEAHSLAGTELAMVTPALESHYAAYFARSKVLAAYQRALGRREDEIDRLRAAVSDLDARIEGQRQRLDAFQEAQDFESFNAAVEPFNAMVAERNRQAQTLNANVGEYNRLISA